MKIAIKTVIKKNHKRHISWFFLITMVKLEGFFLCGAWVSDLKLHV